MIMSTFWSIWITVITLGTIFACLGLLWMCDKNDTGVKEGESMGHSFDGIEELNNPLPKWWKYLFIFTCIGGFIYFALYPGLGSYKGLLGWTSANEYQREIESADEKYAAVFNKLVKTEESNFTEYREIADIAKDKEAVKVGQRLFLQNCSQCHGSSARGAKGFPNLTDGDWLYGGSTADIKTTIMHGRAGVMPGWLPVLGDEKVDQVTTYVVGLSGRKVNAREEAAGKEVFLQTCSACHGADAKGMTMLGAPNLTDKTWLYGGSRKAIEQTISYGRNGVMPAWGDILGEDKVMLLSGYVYSLSVK
ncbi:cytochrome c oxidase, diheme subunit, membrane-bound [Moritella sp. PE36]|nr:cytochrome c oxidase, diheme subunit, membrane-bound [Moritella sp. PE36]